MKLTRIEERNKNECMRMTTKNLRLILEHIRDILPDERVEKAEDEHNPPVTIHLMSKSDFVLLKKLCFLKCAPC